MKYDFTVDAEICQPERLAQELHELVLAGGSLPLLPRGDDRDSRALRRSVRAMVRIFSERDTLRVQLCNL